MMETRNRVHSAWLKTAAGCLAVMFMFLGLAGCSAAATPQPQPTDTQISEPPAATATVAVVETATLLPSPTQASTLTLAPSATPTLPPTATPVPALALIKDGFHLWCAPQSYAGVKLTNPDAVAGANQMVVTGDNIQVKIPAAFCALMVQFNQPAPQGSSLVFYDGKSPFLKLPLSPVDGHVDEGWASVSHAYVINPPFWEVTYQIALLDPDGKEIWSNPVKFAKPLPQPCPFGGLPNPVTLRCAVTDPWEIEPHPDVTYPYNHDALPTESK